LTNQEPSGSIVTDQQDSLATVSGSFRKRPTSGWACSFHVWRLGVNESTSGSMNAAPYVVLTESCGNEQVLEAGGIAFPKGAILQSGLFSHQFLFGIPYDEWQDC